MLGLELSVFLTYAGALLLILLLGKIFLWPLKLIGKLLISSLVGGVLILVVNLIAGMFGLLLIPLNIITAVVVGVLGIPGVILLLILFLF
ncbi:MAG: pro-sigmaK processing inhibitor BofA family protein [Anaerovoracaceae bacterium]|nr:pro-sigmaK processing inhibitor BofA family protein [Anaerovoracaceae bacterium]